MKKVSKEKRRKKKEDKEEYKLARILCVISCPKCGERIIAGEPKCPKCGCKIEE